FSVFYDDSGAIGRRYRRQDEVGTPFCITVDGESATGNSVTVRERDTLQQERVSVDSLRDYIRERITG
ncbi:MAG: glycine--tRNA ligase, partial [Gemmatimonadaceae bacterium]|nr:glycine--tRNA ligase [Gemmatimonadaceae bacterium]